MCSLRANRFIYNTIRNYTTSNKYRGKIPLINFQDTEANIIPILQQTLSDIGFIYLNNTSIQSEHISKILNVSRSFFLNCDQNIKESINCHDTAFRGYYLYQTASINDKIECFSIGKELQDPSILRYKYFEKQGLPKSIWKDYISRRNQWPNEYEKCEEFKSVLLEYYDLCCKTSMDMLSFIAKSLGIENDYFYKFHDLFDCTLEIKYYPCYSDVNKDHFVRLNEHADQTSVTLLIQDVEDGLQIWDKNNLNWFDGISMMDKGYDNEGNVLCNTGNFMELWTNQKYKSTMHRVIGNNQTGNDNGRVSVVFFCFPNHDADIETITTCVDFENGETVAKTVCGDELPYVF
eukprot:417052_1